MPGMITNRSYPPERESGASTLVLYMSEMNVEGLAEDSERLYSISRRSMAERRCFSLAYAGNKKTSLPRMPPPRARGCPVRQTAVRPGGAEEPVGAEEPAVGRFRRPGGAEPCADIMVGRSFPQNGELVTEGGGGEGSGGDGDGGCEYGPKPGSNDCLDVWHETLAIVSKLRRITNQTLH